MERLYALVDFGADRFPYLKEENMICFALCGLEETDHQTKGPQPRTFGQLMRTDRLQGLLEFGVDPLVLRKTNLPSFRCGCKEALSPDHRSTATQVEPVAARGLVARPLAVWGSSLRLQKVKFPRCKEAPSPDHRSTAKHILLNHACGQAARPPGVWA